MEIVVAGRYISHHTSWGDLEWSTCWPGYSDELTFDVSSIPSWFRPGSLVSLVWGGEALWSGTLDEPTRGARLRAAGLWRLLNDYAALDALGELSLGPNTSLEQAIVRGLPVIKTSTWASSAVPLNTDAPPTVAQVQDADVAQTPGLAWGVLPNGEFTRRSRTAPRLHIRPGGDGLGIAWDNYASTLIARYLDSGTSTYTTVTRTDSDAETRWGAREAVVPGVLNDGAPMTSAQAENVLDGMLAKGRARPGWTTPIELAPGALVGDYGQEVDPRTIKPYETVRVHGIGEDIGALPGQTYVDVHIERVRYPSGGGLPVITPVGLVSPMHAVLQRS